MRKSSQSLIRQILHFGASSPQVLSKKVQPFIQLNQSSLIPCIKQLKYTAYHNGLISLSANQIGLDNRLFVILKQNYIKYGRWNQYQQHLASNKPENCYDVVINPQIIDSSKFKIKADQQCPSFLGLKFKVWVPLTNNMKFIKFLQLNQRTNKKQPFLTCKQTLHGFYARVFDHQYRHLQGITSNLQQISHNQIYLNDEYKHNPQNFEYIKNLKMQQQYFKEQNIMKHLAQQVKKHNHESMSSPMKNKLNLQNIPDKIDDQLKAKLHISYQNAMKQKGDIQHMKKIDQFNKKKQPQTVNLDKTKNKQSNWKNKPKK